MTDTSSKITNATDFPDVEDDLHLDSEDSFLSYMESLKNLKVLGEDTGAFNEILTADSKLFGKVVLRSDLAGTVGQAEIVLTIK
jgi:hypothetical protein